MLYLGIKGSLACQLNVISRHERLFGLPIECNISRYESLATHTIQAKGDLIKIVDCDIAPFRGGCGPIWK